VIPFIYTYFKWGFENFNLKYTKFLILILHPTKTRA